MVGQVGIHALAKASDLKVIVHEVNCPPHIFNEGGKNIVEVGYSRKERHYVAVLSQEVVQSVVVVESDSESKSVEVEVEEDIPAKKMKGSRENSGRQSSKKK